MTAPTWVGYSMTHDTSPRALPASSIPRYLRNGREAAVDGGATGSIFETTPTTRAAQWMCRRENRAWGLPLALLGAGGYGLAAAFLHGLHHLAVWGLVALFAWNAAKFTLVSVWLLLTGLATLARRALHRAEARNAAARPAGSVPRIR